MLKFETGQEAYGAGLLALGISFISEDRQKSAGRVWQLRAHDFTLPTHEDVARMIEEAKAELGEDPYILEPYIRTKGSEKFEQFSLVSALLVPLSEAVITGWELAVEFLTPIENPFEQKSRIVSYVFFLIDENEKSVGRIWDLAVQGRMFRQEDVDRMVLSAGEELGLTPTKFRFMVNASDSPGINGAQLILEDRPLAKQIFDMWTLQSMLLTGF